MKQETTAVGDRENSFLHQKLFVGLAEFLSSHDCSSPSWVVRVPAPPDELIAPVSRLNFYRKSTLFSLIYTQIDSNFMKLGIALSTVRFYTQSEMTSQSLWSRYDRHFVGICSTRYNALCGEDLSCHSNKTESVSLV